MSYVSNATELNTNNLTAYQAKFEKSGIDFKTKSAIFENMTGRRVDENTPFVMSEESQVKFGFMGEFFRVSYNATGSHAELVENTAKKYAELRADILDNYKDDEEKMYEKLGELNQAFETALQNTCLMPAYATRINTEIRASYNEADRLLNESELAQISQEYDKYNKNTKDVMTYLQNNMRRHMTTFYESFISEIQTKDFHSAFSESMALLQNSETTSVDEISYNDVFKIRDILTNEATKFNDTDEPGRPIEYRYKTSEDALRALVNDSSIPYVIRKDVAERFSLYLRAE